MSEQGNERVAVRGRALGTWRRRLASALVVVLGAILAFAVFLFVRPVGVADPDGDPRPALTYEAAVARYEEVRDREAAQGDVIAECASKLLTRGERTDRVFVLFHGYTNCPEQYRLLAQQLSDAGYNVYVPLAPEQGEADREHSTLERLTAEKLIAYANESVDIATGLGDEVTVLGLSGGGTVAAYVAQFRDDVDLAIPVAAYLGLPAVPEWLTPALVNLADVLPPIGLGISAAVAPAGIYAPYASYDNNTKSAAAYMKLGVLTRASAGSSAPSAQRTLLVVNEADDTVSNGLIEALAAAWTARVPSLTDTFRFPAAMGLPHDLIGPDREDQRIDEVYPVLLELLEVAAGS